MTDDGKPTHIASEGEGTPALPGETDVAGDLESKGEKIDPEAPLDPQFGVATEQG